MNIQDGKVYLSSSETSKSPGTYRFDYTDYTNNLGHSIKLNYYQKRQVDELFRKCKYIDFEVQ